MEIPAGDAFHESFLLFAIREFQIGREISRYGKCLRFGARLERLRRLPWFVAPDPERACVGRLRSALRAEEALGHVPPALRKLRRTKGHIYIVGIMEEDRKSTRLNSSHGYISYAVFCLKKKKLKQLELIT